MIQPNWCLIWLRLVYIGYCDQKFILHWCPVLIHDCNPYAQRLVWFVIKRSIRSQGTVSIHKKHAVICISQSTRQMVNHRIPIRILSQKCSDISTCRFVFRNRQWPDMIQPNWCLIWGGNLKRRCHRSMISAKIIEIALIVWRYFKNNTSCIRSQRSTCYKRRVHISDTFTNHKGMTAGNSRCLKFIGQSRYHNVGAKIYCLTITIFKLIERITPTTSGDHKNYSFFGLIDIGYTD